VIRTHRMGRPIGKWHRATTWKANEAFWVTSCGMIVFKASAELADSAADACQRCMRSCMPDTAHETTTS
jgi:hypothetical protein